jgi:polyvinyl alcohol dehydrogenase (cytochrome)
MIQRAGLMVVALLSALAHPAAPAEAPAPAAVDGATLFKDRCGSCHERAVDRAPSRAVLGTLSASEILAAMTSGEMAPMSKGLDVAQMQAIAIYLAPSPSESSTAVSPSGAEHLCASNAVLRSSPGDWPMAAMDLTGSRFQPHPGFSAMEVPKLAVKWAFALGGGVYGQPIVIGDFLFVTSRAGQFYALDARTGCVRWMVTGASSRTSPIVAPSSASPSGWATYIGESSRTERALDAASGKEIWRSSLLDAHPLARLSGSAVVSGDLVFVPISSAEEVAAKRADYSCCSFRGALVALDKATGAVRWKTSVITEPIRTIRKNAIGIPMQGPAGAAIWSAPTADEKRGLVYVATGDSYTEAQTRGSDAIVSIDMQTGHIQWSTQVTANDNYVNGCAGPGLPTANCPNPLGSDFDFGGSPILFTLSNGRQILLSGQKSGLTYGMDPDSGAILWSTRVGSGSSLGGVEWGIGADQSHLYAPNADTMNLMEEARRAQGRPARKTIPLPPAAPSLTAIDPATGRIIWQTPTPKAPCRMRGECIRASSAPPAVMPGVVFSGSTDGWLRAYDSASGAIIWAFSTSESTYATVNGVANQPGGAIDGTGPTIADGMVFTLSGYNGAESFGGNGVNVLLAFSVNGR